MEIDITRGRIIFPETADSIETIIPVVFEPSDNPDILRIYLEGGTFIGTIGKPSLQAKL